MKVIITGGAGFLGQRLASRILDQGLNDAGGRACRVSELVLADQLKPTLDTSSDDRVTARVGDLRDAAFLASLIDQNTDAVFHLAAVVSAGAEADFDLGMSVNVHASLGLLECCRALVTRPRVVFTSSVAVYGGDIPDVVMDHTILTPRSSYGTQKAVTELLLNDYSRKGYVDGRCVRLPTIVVRPGKPNQAASSFVSGIIREPLQGESAECPVPADTALWVLSPRRAIDGLILAHDLAPEHFVDSTSVALPGLTVTVREMLDALAEIAGREVADRVRMAPDPLVAAIVQSWPSRFVPDRGRALGFEADESIVAIIEAFIEDDLKPAAR